MADPTPKLSERFIEHATKLESEIGAGVRLVIDDLLAKALREWAKEIAALEARAEKAEAERDGFQLAARDYGEALDNVRAAGVSVEAREDGGYAVTNTRAVEAESALAHSQDAIRAYCDGENAARAREAKLREAIVKLRRQAGGFTHGDDCPCMAECDEREDCDERCPGQEPHGDYCFQHGHDCPECECAKGAVLAALDAALSDSPPVEAIPGPAPRDPVTKFLLEVQRVAMTRPHDGGQLDEDLEGLLLGARELLAGRVAAEPSSPGIPDDSPEWCGKLGDTSCMGEPGHDGPCAPIAQALAEMKGKPLVATIAEAAREVCDAAEGLRLALDRGERQAAPAPAMHLPAQMAELRGKLLALRQDLGGPHLVIVAGRIDEILRLVPVAHDENAHGGKPESEVG